MRYNERVVEELHLPVEKIDFGQAKPQVFKADQAEGHVWTPVARPVLQQDLPNALPSLLTSSLKALQVYFDEHALAHCCLCHGSVCYCSMAPYLTASMHDQTYVHFASGLKR